MSDVAYLGVYDWETYFEGGDVGGGSADLSAIAEDALPATTNAYDLGSQAKRWADVYVTSLKGVVPDYSAGSGMTAGVQPLIHLEEADAGGGNLYQVLVVGGSGPLGSEITFDPFWNGVFYTYADQTVGMGDYDPVTGYGQDGQNRSVQSALSFLLRDVASNILFRAATSPDTPNALEFRLRGLAESIGSEPEGEVTWKDFADLVAGDRVLVTKAP